MMQEEWLTNRYKIKGYIDKHVSDHHEAEDLLQDVALRFLNHQAKDEPLDNVNAWLFKVTKGVVVDYYRRKNKVFPVEDVQAVESDSGVNAMGENFNMEIAACLTQLIGTLSPTDQKAIIESDWRGIKQKQLAEEWKISYSGSKNRVQRARKKLKKELLNCCQVKLDRLGNVIEFNNKMNPSNHNACDYDKCGSFSSLPRLNK